MFRELVNQIPDYLQEKYNAHRAPELWGTEEVSPFFFDTWRERGLWSAFLWLTIKEKEMGNPKLPPALKASINLAGSYALTLGVRPDNMDTAGNWQLFAFGATLGMLMDAQETVTSTGLAGDPTDSNNNQTVTHTMSGKEYDRIAAQFDPKQDRCLADTIQRLHV